MRPILPMFALAFAISAPALAEAVAVPPFTSVELRGGGDLMIVPGQVQRVTLLAGSAQVTRFNVDRDGQLEIVACAGHCPSNYKLRVRIESPRVPNVAIQGGGTIVAQRGFAPQHTIAAAVSRGGKIDLGAVDAEDVSAAINHGGDILVRAHASLSAAVNRGGDIRYAGNPRVSMAVQGGGDVRRVD